MTNVFDFSSQDHFTKLVVMKSQSDWDYAISLLENTDYSVTIFCGHMFPNVPYANIGLRQSDSEPYISTSTMPDGRLKMTVNPVNPKQQYSLRWSSTTQECLLAYAAASLAFFKNIPVYSLLIKQDVIMGGQKNTVIKSQVLKKSQAAAPVPKKTKSAPKSESKARSKSKVGPKGPVTREIGYTK